jgi:hypothetical protein
LFPRHVSCVPFVWQYFERAYDMSFAAGLLAVDHTDGFLSPRLGFAVLEHGERRVGAVDPSRRIGVRRWLAARRERVARG